MAAALYMLWVGEDFDVSSHCANIHQLNGRGGESLATH